MEELARIVKDARLRRGMRGIDLAYAIGKDPGYVTKMEHATLKEIPAPETIRALSETLGVSETRLLRAIGYGATEPDDPVADGDPLAPAFARLSPAARALVRDLVDGILRLDEIPDRRRSDPATRPARAAREHAKA